MGVSLGEAGNVLSAGEDGPSSAGPLRLSRAGVVRFLPESVTSESENEHGNAENDWAETVNVSGEPGATVLARAEADGHRAAANLFQPIHVHCVLTGTSIILVVRELVIDLKANPAIDSEPTPLDDLGRSRDRRPGIRPGE